MFRRSCGCALVAAVVVGLFIPSTAGAAERFVVPTAAQAADGVINLTSSAFDPAAEAAVSTFDDDSDYYDEAPLWTVWAGTIFLQRENPGGRTLASAGPLEFLNANDLTFGTQAGPDLNAIRHGDAFDIGFRYFHVNNMSAHERLFPGGPIDLELGTPYSIDCPQLDSFYLTSIQSVELNLRKNLTPNLTVLAGFRYVSLRDNLFHTFDVFADPYSLYTMHMFTNNRLYGAQIGLDANVLTFGRFQLQTALKGGVYGNYASNQFRLRVLELFDSGVGTNEKQTSFVGDWNFTGVFQLTDVWAIRGGYQLLWLSNIALSSEQFPLVDPGPPPTIKINTSGDLFLHGALVSLQAGW